MPLKLLSCNLLLTPKLKSYGPKGEFQFSNELLRVTWFIKSTPKPEHNLKNVCIALELRPTRILKQLRLPERQQLILMLA